jgi:homoserine dehydrogenase
VLKKIAGILAGRKISIASVTQKEKRSQRIVPIVMMTHAAQERAMAAAVREIDHLSVIKKKSVKIRIED